jgi:8-oxo-dGTP diphosphatase
MADLQFGEVGEGRAYVDRPAAFGVVVRDGLLAVAAITIRPGQPPVFDLPGGGIDPGETEIEALVREFGEEAGLKVAPGAFLMRARQRYISPEGRAVNNHGAFYAAEVIAEAAALKIEDDHELVWMTPAEFVQKARHEAQAWAVCVWLRNNR